MKIRYRAQALADLGSIHEHIAQTNRFAAQKTVERLHKTIQRLKVFPHSGRAGAVDGTRELISPGLPYIIVYRLEDEFADIVAVMHGAKRRGS
ncbi:MAG: type II toxin-antitoxin system RelE/ParE family toxin [Hyphomicrobiales bacterium]|nr:type II toxin-antitoxin system RelE/ParE family toxin [Hyphomicrobiales bacterium]